MLDLQPFPLGLRQGLVVRNLRDHLGHVGPERGLQFDGRRGGVLDRVVQDRGLEGDHVGDAARAREEVGDLDQVVHVGRAVRTFAPLVAVAMRGESEGGQ